MEGLKYAGGKDGPGGERGSGGDAITQPDSDKYLPPCVLSQTFTGPLSALMGKFSRGPLGHKRFISRLSFIFFSHHHYARPPL